jgi:hypothetical protein
MIVRLPCDLVETLSSTCGTLPARRLRRPDGTLPHMSNSLFDAADVRQAWYLHSAHGGGAARMHTQPGQPRRGGGRRVGAGWPGPEPSASVPDERAETLREYLEGLRLRAQGAASWLESSSQYAQLLNREGFVPVTAKFTAHSTAAGAACGGGPARRSASWTRSCPAACCRADRRRPSGHGQRALRVCRSRGLAVP